MKILPPIADEDLLVEDGTIGTEERDRVEEVVISRIRQTDVVGLALLGGVGVVAAIDEAGAGEVRLLDGGQDGVVQPGLPWHGGSQPVQRVSGAIRGGGGYQPQPG